MKNGINAIYENYISGDLNRDTEQTNKIYDEIMEIINPILSMDLQSKIFDLINDYAINIEEQSFKDGFKYAASIWKECEM